MFSRMMYAFVAYGARKGLYQAPPPAAGTPETGQANRHERRRTTGVRGETYAYWYLRRHGYVLIAKNYRAQGVKGEIDLVGYDRDVLAFVEVKTRRMRQPDDPLPEDNITTGKQFALARMARQFLRDWRLRDVPWRFDLLAIEDRPGQPPVVRLHKDAFRQSGPLRPR